MNGNQTEKSWRSATKFNKKNELRVQIGNIQISAELHDTAPQAGVMPALKHEALNSELSVCAAECAATLMCLHMREVDTCCQHTGFTKMYDLLTYT